MRNRMTAFLTVVFMTFIYMGASFAHAAGGDFASWLDRFRVEAAQKGISQHTIERALSDIEANPRVIELDRKQPESRITFAKYRENVVNQTRITLGRRMMAQYRDLLNETSARYGVPAQYIVALWGIETNYGSNTGGFNIIPALATLAWEGRRADFFKGELIDALRIVDQGHVRLSDFKGSWAGALGQCQFMPSSFHAYAVDANGDGKKDIWHNKADVFASTANYLARHGWNKDQTWGREVRVPSHFTENLVGLEVKKSLSEWARLGVTLPGGGALPQVAGMEASLITPDGLGGATYLVYDNYRTIMRWNRSTYFATSVGLLANALAQ